MAHKKLITKYAKQLTESNQRIVELEVAVADARAELDMLKVRSVAQQGADIMKVKRCFHKLKRQMQTIAKLTTLTQDPSMNGVLYERPGTIFGSFEPTKAKQRIIKLERNLEHRAAALQGAKEEVEAVKERARGEAEDAVARESKHWQKRNRDLLAASKASETELRALKASANGPAQLQQANDIATLQAKIDNLKIQVQAFKEQAKAGMRDVKALNKAIAGRNGSMVTKVRSLEGQLAKSDRGEKFAALSSEVEELKVKLDREKKRTREAEAMLGPDGKRCKRCCPVVIDLEDGAVRKEIKVAMHGAAAAPTDAAAVAVPGWRPLDRASAASLVQG